jgi:CBS domain-containing protein
MGFGVSGRIHSLHIVDLSSDLPVIIEWIDDASRVEQLLPEITAAIQPGLVTIEDTCVTVHAPHVVRDIPRELTAATVMTRNPIFVNVDTPVVEVVERMRTNRLRAVPVVDGTILVGIISNGDLVTRAGLGAHLPLLLGLPSGEIQQQLDKLQNLVARDVMTTPIVSIPSGLSLHRAAMLMVQRKLKRLPVVDEHKALIGVLSRVDLLHSVAHFTENITSNEPTFASNVHLPLNRIVRHDVPTVFADTPIESTLQAVISTRLNVALVVDKNRSVIGLVTSTELLRRVTPQLRPNLLSTLVHRLPLFRRSASQLESERHTRANTAAGLMTQDFVTANADSPLHEVVSTMVSGSHKVVAVVDNEKHLIGVVDRADVLRGLLWTTVP